MGGLAVAAHDDLVATDLGQAAALAALVKVATANSDR